MVGKKNEMSMGDLVTVALDRIKPYWRNPRRISDEAVETVKESIKKYGYQQPIVVDDDYVIIVGHTRYTALRRLGVEEIPVLVASHLSEKKVKEYRLIDNRTAEYTSWDFDVLVEELQALDSEFGMLIFQDIVGTEDILSAEDKAQKEWDQVVPDADMICPSCYHEFTVKVTREAVLGGLLTAEGESA